MQLSKVPSVKDTYFQHKVLTRIHHRPSYESLQNCLNELKANASSVPSTLGGGMHGHLGLLLSDTNYGSLTNNVLFVIPVNPGPFVPPAGATGPQIDAAKDVWIELCSTFQVCHATEQALIAQVIEIIDPSYLRAILNTATGRYAANIRALLLHLFTTYGKVTPQQIMSKEHELATMHYDLSHPVDIVFNAIEDLSELAAHARQPMSQMQLINLAYVIFAKQPILLQDLRTWNRLPLADRTWPNMKTHLRDAQDDLSALPTASAMYHQQAPFPHQANIATITDMVAQRLMDNQAHHERAYAEMYEQQFGPPPPAPAPVPTPAPAPVFAPPIPEPIADMANTVQPRETALMAQMQQMMQQMMANNSGGGGRNHYNQGGRGRGRGRGNPINNRNSTARKYCWSHGACAHNGTECNTKATGHKNEATFTNMMGGSTRGCYWINT
jgi:hypothetical protein